MWYDNADMMRVHMLHTGEELLGKLKSNINMSLLKISYVMAELYADNEDTLAQLRQAITGDDQDYQRRISNQLRDMFDDPFNPKIIEPPKRVIAETTAIKNVVQREIKKLYRQSLEVNDYLEEFGSKGVSEEIKLADQVLDRSFHDAKHLGALIKCSTDMLAENAIPVIKSINEDLEKFYGESHLPTRKALMQAQQRALDDKTENERRVQRRDEILQARNDGKLWG